jgi:hypothetical protein
MDGVELDLEQIVAKAYVRKKEVAVQSAVRRLRSERRRMVPVDLQGTAPKELEELNRKWAGKGNDEHHEDAGRKERNSKTTGRKEKGGKKRARR